MTKTCIRGYRSSCLLARIGLVFQFLRLKIVGSELDFRPTLPLTCLTLNRMSSSAASLRAAAADSDSQTLDGFEIILAATPEPPVVERAANNHLNEALSQQQPAPGTVVNLPPSEAGSEEPSAKRIRYSDFPVWQVGVECTGLELSLFSMSFLI